MSACAHARFVDLHFAVRILPDEEQDLRAHLESCHDCRERYRRQLLLAQLDPRGASPRDRLARGLGFRQRGNRRWWLAIVTAGAMAAAGLALWPRAAVDGDFTPRGGAATLPALVVYRLDASGSSRPASAAIGSSDELAFAYRNPAGRKFLLVFGVDEHRHVYWYHPGWTDAAQDPTAVPIRATPDLTELPEAIAHRLYGARLTLHALLLDAPVSVREVEDRLARGASPLIPGAQEEELVLEVHR